MTDITNLNSIPPDKRNRLDNWLIDSSDGKTLSEEVLDKLIADRYSGSGVLDEYIKAGIKEYILWRGDPSKATIERFRILSASTPSSEKLGKLLEAENAITSDAFTLSAITYLLDPKSRSFMLSEMAFNLSLKQYSGEGGTDKLVPNDIMPFLKSENIRTLFKSIDAWEYLYGTNEQLAKILSEHPNPDISNSIRNAKNVRDEGFMELLIQLKLKNLPPGELKTNVPVERILVVEDNESNLATARTMFENLPKKIEVDYARDFKTFAGLLFKNRYDAVITDMLFPYDINNPNETLLAEAVLNMMEERFESAASNYEGVYDRDHFVAIDQQFIDNYMPLLRKALSGKEVEYRGRIYSPQDQPFGVLAAKFAKGLGIPYVVATSGHAAHCDLPSTSAAYLYLEGLISNVRVEEVGGDWKRYSEEWDKDLRQYYNNPLISDVDKKSLFSWAGILSKLLHQVDKVAAEKEESPSKSDVSRDVVVSTLMKLMHHADKVGKNAVPLAYDILQKYSKREKSNPTTILTDYMSSVINNVLEGNLGISERAASEASGQSGSIMSGKTTTDSDVLINLAFLLGGNPNEEEKLNNLLKSLAKKGMLPKFLEDLKKRIEDVKKKVERTKEVTRKDKL